MLSTDVREHSESALCRAVRISLCGCVQGLGVRPAIARLAKDLDLSGTVVNRRDGVEIIVEGLSTSVALFQQRLAAVLPAAAVIDERHDTEISLGGQESFKIIEEFGSGPVGTQVPRDVAVCKACLQETSQPDDRRHAYPLASCTQCGPRYSVITQMPYERPLTTLRSFPLCIRCRAEYENPRDRRFHAQTTACSECGPQVWCTDSAGRQLGTQDTALATAGAALRRGDILAMRGMGGYQLLCDATSENAVQRLRARKSRPTKPLAILVDSLEVADHLAFLDCGERECLSDPSNPIVLAKARHDSGLSAGIRHPLKDVGLMLPTTPLHWYLASQSDCPLVATSGNREGEPLAVGVAEAQRHLSGIADLFLHHNREIARPVDDSVMRMIAGRAVTLRLARGLAPLPLRVSEQAPVLALGSHQKAAVALSNGRQAVLGPYVGDLDGLATCERFLEQIEGLEKLYGTKPQLLVHDLHPHFFTTRWAKEQSVKTLAVQHHYAHIVAGMVEHNWLNREVLGVAFDGTGYGPDGTIWGGEFLRCTTSRFDRVGCLRRFTLPGGEAAIREPWRIAVGIVLQAVGPEMAHGLNFPDVSQTDQARLIQLAQQSRLSPTTTSAGRLFDAIAALVLDIGRVHYEGEAAMLLEAACDPTITGAYELPIREGQLLEVDWRPMIVQLLTDRAEGASPETMATRFHRGLAQAIVAVARRFTGMPVVLSGGVFQNRFLGELLTEAWGDELSLLGLPGTIPPNDGGLAAGQLAIALTHFQQQET